MSGWVKVKKASRSAGKYDEYQGQPVIVINGTGDLLIMKCVDEMLGKPLYIEILEDVSGGKIAINPSSDKRDFKITRRDERANQTPKVALRPFFSKRNMIVKDHSVVYRLYEIDGLFTFDTHQKPELV